MVDDFPNDPSRHVVMLLIPTIKHYEMFANMFVQIMAQSVDVSMLWGLLFLVVKVQYISILGKASPLLNERQISLLESPDAIERISRMLKNIGNKIELINKWLEYRLRFHDDDIKGTTLVLNQDIVYLWLHIITMFRNQDLGEFR